MAVQTTDEILSYHQDKQFEFSSLLRERSLGVLEGKPDNEVKKFLVKNGIREYRPVGGESLDDLLTRVEELYNEIIIKYCKKDYSEKEVRNIKINPIFKKKATDVTQLKNKTNFELLFDTKPDFKYLKYNFDELLENFEFKKITKVYPGLDTDLNIPRVLLITHKIYIQEFLNLIRKNKNITNFQNYSETHDTALYIFRIFCPQCVGICYSKNEKCKLDYEIILYNDIEHL
jgi:hypothetical protein